jgi:exodeoxyribonuclease-3
MKIVTWNVNGIRAIMKKDFLGSLAGLNPDVLCLQETKATVEEVKKALSDLDGEYEIYANESKTRKGYSGTAVLSRVPLTEVKADIAVEKHDQEGRVLTAEFDGFYLVNVYTPNSGQGLKRLEYRAEWDADFRNYVSVLEKTKPVVVCGDLNVAHQEIDLARPKQNYNKSAGYTQQEIDGLTAILDSGYVDIFRERNPETVAYTYWNYMFNARARNVGWRIDYFLPSQKLLTSVRDVSIEPDFMGSDHCPVSLYLEFD